MNKNSEFSCDIEFMKLMTRSEDVNLTAAALELARDAYPDLNFSEVFDWIDARVDELSRPMAQARTEIEALQTLSECLAGRHGIRGTRDSYEIADSSYLNCVIAGGQGIPISLSVLYMAVAGRAGITLQGVSSPGHFLTRYESVEGPLFVDAFSGGEILTEKESKERIRSMTGYSHELLATALEPVGSRTIIVRMLNNLKALHARQGNWSEAWVVQHRLTSLQPTSYGERRDMALISLKAGRPGLALELLEACLRKCPREETKILAQHLEDAKQQLASWN